MAVYIVTGKLGNGKSLCSVGRIRDKLRAGCMVASNIDLNLSAMFGTGINTKTIRVLRVPDKPTVSDLEMIGNANPTYDESKNGLLVLDECGTWFNARNWQDKSRQAVNDWFLHARKLGWDVIIIVQDISLIDSQAREALSEHTVFCKRIDNLQIPLIGTLFKAITGIKLKLPRLHVARVVYGVLPTDMLSDRWVYRGNDLFACYDTKQMFLSNYPHGTYSVLTPWHIKGRHQLPRNLEFYMRYSKIVWKRFRAPIALGAGALIGVAFTAATAFASIYPDLKKQAEAMPVKQEPLKVIDDGLKTLIPNLKIAASIGSKKGFIYQFQDKTNASRYVLSSDLVKSGVVVTPINDCQVRLKYNAQINTIYCL